LAEGKTEGKRQKAQGKSSFLLKNTIAWLLMVVVLVVVPDTLEPWLRLEIGRAVGWAVAFPVWIPSITQSVLG
jgi:hypothetical protein